MRVIRFLVVLATAIATISVPATGLAQESVDQAESQSWIVVMAPSAEPAFEGELLTNAFDISREFTFSNVLNGFTFRGTADSAALLRNHPWIRAVVPDGIVTLSETPPEGIRRIDADDAHLVSNGGHTGAGVRIIVIDSGIDLDHPDLIANIDLDTSHHRNCQNPGSPPEDDHGHGTHVSGTAAAADNGIGVVGVAPEATIVPVKSFDSTGNATVSEVICGIDHAAGLALDGMPTVVNMSFAEGGVDSVCDDADATDVLHEAVCDLVDTGAIAVAAAGNSATNASSTMPANFAETIAVSATVDLDGSPGGLGGCEFDILTFLFHCDDTFAGFSNYGAVVDIAAPGALVNSTRPNGSYGDSSGTSMSSPHVAGVAALMLAADPTLDLASMRDLMQETGDCPDGGENGSPGVCSGATWSGDPDGVAEPLVNALRATQAATGIRWSSPHSGDLLEGVVPVAIRVTSDDPAGSSTVDWRVGGGTWTPAAYNAGTGLYESSLDSAAIGDGYHVLEARSVNAAGTETAAITVQVSAYASAVAADGPIAYWRLDDSTAGVAADIAGAHSSPYVGSPAVGAGSLLTPDPNGAVNFDGVDDLVAVGDASDINTGGPYTSRTIELWFNATDSTPRQVLFEEGGITRGLAVYVDEGDIYFIGWNNRDDDPTTPWGPVWVSAPVASGATYHVALTLDQVTDELTGYVNGASVGSASGVGKLFAHGANVGLGAMSDDIKFHDGAVTNSGYAYHFGGTIDEVALYNTVLSPGQIVTHASVGGATTAVPPSATIVAPSSGATLSGDTPIAIDATDDADPAGSLNVEWRIDGGTWSATTYNGATGLYEATWDTTTVTGGVHTVQARAVDSDSAVSTDLVSVTINNSSSYENAVVSDGAVAFWRLGEANGTTAIDSAGSNNSGYVGSPSLGAQGLISGDSNAAVDFDGSDDLVAVPGAGAINTGGPYSERTVELWFNADDVISRQVLFEEGGLSRGLAVYVDQGSVYFIGWNLKNDDPTTPWGPTWLSAPVAAGTTYHAALVLGGGNGLEAFLNGASLGSDAGAGTLFKHGAKVAIGAMDDDVVFHTGAVNNSGRDFHFDGTIDDVAIYNTALSAVQIANHVALGGGSTAVPPTVSIVDPVAGSQVSGTVPIAIDAADDADPTGTLTVEWRIDAGSWSSASFNGGTGLYEATWDTTTANSGPHAVQARAIDSELASASASVGVTVNNSSSYEAAVLADGAVAYWRLDESSGSTANDVAGSHNAPYVGSPTLGGTGLLAEGNAAVVFDGVNDMISVPDATAINSGGPYSERSIELWFSADDVATRQVLFEEGGLTRGIAMYLDQGNLYYIAWNDRNDDGTSPWGPVWVSTPVTAATTYHVVLVLDQPNGSLDGYLNGSSAGSQSGVGNLFRHVANIGIGAMDDDVRFHDGSVNNSGTAYHYAGTLDEVAIYNSALTMAQVAGHFALG